MSNDAHLKSPKDREFVTRLFESAFQGEGAAVVMLVQEYAQQHKLPIPTVLNQFRDGQKRTLLHFASHSVPRVEHDEDIVPLLLSIISSRQAQAELLQLKDKQGLTPLMFAAQNKNGSLGEKRVDCILNAGGNKLALARSKAGATALHYAAAAENTTPTTLIRLYNAAKIALSTNSHQSGTPLHWAAAISPPANHVLTMKTLVEQCHADVNVQNEHGMSPLLMAAASRNDNHCEYLVKAGADISTELPGSISIFHMAADLNLKKTMAALMLKTRDDATVQKYLEKRTETGETPLHVALHEGHVECVLLLSDAEDEAAALALIEAAKQNAPPKQQPQKVVDIITPSSPSATALLNNDKSKEEQEALEIVQQLAGLSISDDDTRQSLELKRQGNEYFEKKEWQAALDFYTKAIALNPTDASLYSNRSACYMELELYQEALKDAVVARYIRPDWSKACYRMAVARMALGRYEDAAVSAFEALNYDEDNEEIKQLLREAVTKGQIEYHAQQNTTNQNKDPSS
jgi:ankyrin repeat protein